jgi:hypothetical protein
MRLICNSNQQLFANWAQKRAKFKVSWSEKGAAAHSKPAAPPLNCNMKSAGNTPVDVLTTNADNGGRRRVSGQLNFNVVLRCGVVCCAVKWSDV